MFSEDEPLVGLLVLDGGDLRPVLFERVLDERSGNQSLDVVGRRLGFFGCRLNQCRRCRSWCGRTRRNWPRHILEFEGQADRSAKQGGEMAFDLALSALDFG